MEALDDEKFILGALIELISNQIMVLKEKRANRQRRKAFNDDEIF